MNIWAHRGCSQCYPENTLLAFEKAAAIKGLSGIELDIQLTKDSQMVVCHDEKVDRTTSGIGFVKDYTFAELRNLVIGAADGSVWKIPTIEEVLDLLKEPMKNGLRLNIELKNSSIPYDGMEEKIVDLVHARGMEKQVVYSSFRAKSMEKIRSLDPDAETGILDTKVSDCLYKLRGGTLANALHPYWKGIDLSPDELKGYTVRAWFTGHLFPEKPNGNRLDLAALEARGITDVFLNEPEVYL